MRNLGLVSIAVILLAACQSAPPASNPANNPGVGFNDYATYAGQQAGMNTAPTSSLSSPGAISSGAIGSGDLAAAGIGGSGMATNMVPANAPLAIQSSGISDEQDFNAVSGRESIESDAQRLAQAAANYQVVQPTALTQPQNTGPNIVEYAINAPNRVGQSWYSRFIFSGQGRFERNCASYRTPDEAQRDFLIRGGPDRDPRGIDPDGDGFACGWDPAPFRAAVGRSN